ncbi:MAG: hypothetical protein MUC43_06275 [Pirellula sp.]|nr:hypothetical protein [Pirellula sp.]
MSVNILFGRFQEVLPQGKFTSLVTIRLMTIVCIMICGNCCIAQNPRLVLQPAARESIHARLDRDQLEELLYGTLGGSKQAFRRSKKESIQRYVDQVDQVCNLSDEQLTKVQSAIDVEIARWESRITALLSDITPSTEPTQKQTIFTQAWSKALEFQNEPKETEATVWYKTLVSTLTPEQLGKWAADREQMKIRERNVTRFRILLLAQRSLGLSKAQRDVLNELLVKYDADRTTHEMLTFEQLYVFLKSQGDLSLELSAKQWAKLESLVKGQGGAQILNLVPNDIALP